MLGLERRYHLDDGALNAAWRRVSRKVHPDRFAGRPAVERRMSLQWTAAINEARRVLLNPDARARYLATGDPKPAERGGPMLDPEFLEEMFDLRMQAEGEPDAVRPVATALQSELRAEIDRIFSAWEAGDGSLDGVDERLARMKYLNNLMAEIEVG